MSIKYSTSNMHLYSTEGNIKKYTSVNEIIDEFYDLRLVFYQKRKHYMLHKLLYIISKILN